MSDLFQVIDEIGLSMRTANLLKKSGIFTVSDLLNTSSLELSSMGTKGLGQKSIDEAMQKADELRAEYGGGDIFKQSGSMETADAAKDNFSEWIKTPDAQTKTIAWLENRQIHVSSLTDLPARAYNILFLNGYTLLHQIAFMDEDELMRIPRMDRNNASEIKKIIARYLEGCKESILLSISKSSTALPNQTITLSKLLRAPAYRDSIIKFVEINDKELLQLEIPQKICRKLLKTGIKRLSDLFSLPWNELKKMNMLSQNYADEVVRRVNTYLKENSSRLIAFCNGDESVLWDDEAISVEILNAYTESPFRGFSLNDFREKLQIARRIPEERLKKVLGKLVANGSLEYVDFRCYRIYKSFSNTMESCSDLDEWKKEYVRCRLAGMTLEEIGKKFNRTREGIRQVIVTAVRTVRSHLLAETGTTWFDEDYYRYFYTTYDCSQIDAEQWLGISPNTWYYLEMVCSNRGKNNIESAIDDHSNLDLGFRLKIKNFINSGKLFVDGIWIKKKRDSLDRYVVQHFCKDEVSFQEYMTIYNDFLEQEEVDPGEDTWLDEKVVRTRRNYLANSRFVLWSFSERFRYYDIDGRDYSELLETIGIDSYENIELSTLKFMNDYPETMRRYDIRNQYELHNLLKKIIPDDSYNGFHCGRMPIIEFGTFNRIEAISNLIISNSPLTQEELETLIYNEYGFETGAIPWRAISKYKVGDIYRTESKVMSDDNMDVLKVALPDNFYYIDEIRNIQSKVLPGSDPEEINSYNLTNMGFVVYPDYVIQNYYTADSYFEDILTNEDIVDLGPLKKRYGARTFFYMKVLKLKRSLEIIEFEPDKVINIRKLLNIGVSQNALVAFCDEVYEFIQEETYFSMESLHKAGFTSDLFDLGFSDWFYANLLAMDDRFAYNRMFGNIILYKGQKDITIKSFAGSIVQDYGSIDVYDLLNVLNNDYGCNPKDRYDVLYKVQGEGIYYDDILDRLYASEEIYYQELESMEND